MTPEDIETAAIEAGYAECRRVLNMPRTTERQAFLAGVSAYERAMCLEPKDAPLDVWVLVLPKCDGAGWFVAKKFSPTEGYCWVDEDERDYSSDYFTKFRPLPKPEGA